MCRIPAYPVDLKGVPSNVGQSTKDLIVSQARFHASGCRGREQTFTVPINSKFIRFGCTLMSDRVHTWIVVKPATEEDKLKLDGMEA